MLDEIREKISFACDASGLLVRSKRLNSSFLKTGLCETNAKNCKKIVALYLEVVKNFIKVHPDIGENLFKDNFKNSEDILKIIEEYLKDQNESNGLTEEEKKKKKKKWNSFDASKITLILKQMTEYLNLIYEQTYIEVMEKQYKLLSSNLKEKQEELSKLKESYKIDADGLKKFDEKSNEAEEKKNFNTKKINLIEMINSFLENNPKPKELDLSFLETIKWHGGQEKTRYKFQPEKINGKFERNIKKAPASRPFSVEKEEKIKSDAQMALKKDEPEMQRTFHR